MSDPVSAEIDIANMALSSIGHTEYINDLTATSNEAETANRWYATCRDEVLRDAPWPFAKKRITPAVLLKTTLALAKVPGGWGFAFAYPADCIRVRKIYAGIRAARVDQEQPYVIEFDSALKANIILADIDTPEIEYTVRLTDVTRFSADFVNALQWRLAVPLAAALRKDAETVKLAQGMYERALGKANANAQTESRGDVPPKPSWIANR